MRDGGNNDGNIVDQTEMPESCADRIPVFKARKQKLVEVCRKYNKTKKGSYKQKTVLFIPVCEDVEGLTAILRY